MIAERFMVLIIVLYLALLFGVAWWVQKGLKPGSSWVANRWIYALSISVYCTTWAYYGSVGKAASDGISFITTYLGPVIFMPLWFWLTSKMIKICRQYRITSLADFISSRYSKSSFLGGFVAVFCVIVIVPYIAIQLKAIGTGYDILVGNQQQNALNISSSLLGDSNFYLTCILILFVILFGTRNIETTTKNHGLISVVAFEAVVKLIAFITVGCFVCFYVFDGFGDLFEKAGQRADLSRLFTLQPQQSNEWFTGLALAFLAMLFLPRQFQTAVLENNSIQHVKTSTWAFPLYLLAINFFVLPIAIGGKLLLENNVDPDTFVLTIPLEFGNYGLAAFSYIGGFSASTSMIVVSTYALTNMTSNNLVMPLIARSDNKETQISSLLLLTRRLGVLIILLLAYLYQRLFADNSSIVSTGLISFVGVVQFAPATLLGMYWKDGNRKAAIASFAVGFTIWFYMLIIPNMASVGMISEDILTNGLFGSELLKPQSLFGISHLSTVTLCFMISLSLNLLTYLSVSIFTAQSAIGQQQAELFVNVDNYPASGDGPSVWKGTAKTDDLKQLLNRVLGEVGAANAVHHYERIHGDWQAGNQGDSNRISYVETVLAGAVGIASARILISSVAEEEDLKLEDLLTVARESKELLMLNKQLKSQSEVLERTTTELTTANARLKMLDKEKDLFISTVTHELRTPITSIRSFAEILYDNPDLSSDEKAEFLEIIVRETERISRLISEVLDLEKLQSGTVKLALSEESITHLIADAVASVKQLAIEKNLTMVNEAVEHDFLARIDRDRLTQVLINLLSNAIKYHDKENGVIKVKASTEGHQLVISVADNGPGMEREQYEKVFQKFYQIRKKDNIKDKGVGLGLAISRSIVDLHGGNIKISSVIGAGTEISISLPTLI